MNHSRTQLKASLTLFSFFLLSLLLSCTDSTSSNPTPTTNPTSTLKKLIFSTTAVVSSLQLEMSSTLQITNIGAVIRLATEAAPTKAQAEANPGYVNLAITTNSPRKFSISQHYGSDFTDGLTLADVLAPNTNYTLYLYFEANAIPSNTTIEGATLVNNKITLPFTTTTLPAAGDPVWNTAWANEEFVESLPEWSYSENQKQIFVVYMKVNLASFSSISITTHTTTDAANGSQNQALGSLSVGNVLAEPGFLFHMSELEGSYPAAGDYYCIIVADDTRIMSGKAIKVKIADLLSQSFTRKVPLNSYSNL